jgi:hypothetical protein
VTTQHRQRDGKIVTIDPRGSGKRFLPSGEADAEPLVGLEGGWERTWYELMGRRALDDKPLTAEDIAFARPTPETIVAFNRARADLQKAAFALRDALEDTSGEVLARIEMAAGQMDWIFG